MGYWGKVIGGVAGLAMGGPFGAMVGAALGHAADEGAIPRLGGARPGMFRLDPARVAAMLGQRDQLFAIGVVTLSAKLAKADGPVNRMEIDGFKRSFRIPPDSVGQVGRLFDQARQTAEGYESLADQIGVAFADNRGVLEDVLVALFAIARSDGPVNVEEAAFLRRVHAGFRLDRVAWERAAGGTARPSTGDEADPYVVLGVDRRADDDAVRAAWKRLMRENHPDSLAARGVPEDFIKRATDKVARINAAWDRVKRERGL